MVNVYGPNKDNIDFYLQLFQYLDSRDNTSLMLAGDFNLTLEPQDLYNNSGLSHFKKRQILLEYMEHKGLLDVWRLTHSQEKMFTWRKPHVKELVMSRLDFFLLTQDLFLRMNKVDIKTRYNSDHSRVVLNMDFAPDKWGRGYWKFNNLHLRDKNFLDVMNAAINKFRYQVKTREEIIPENQWENLKRIMQDVAKDFSINKAKERNKMIEKFEKRILFLDSKLLEAQDQQTQDKIRQDIKRTEQFLLDEHEVKVQAACFKSKAQYYLEGERNNRYFFNLEKSRSSSKAISKLIREDGSIIKDTKRMLEEEKLFYKKLYGRNPPRNWLYVNNSESKLTDEEKEALDTDFTDQELGEALKGMQMIRLQVWMALQQISIKFFGHKLEIYTEV